MERQQRKQVEAVVYERVDSSWVRIKAPGEEDWRKYAVSLSEAEEVADAYRVPLVEATR